MKIGLELEYWVVDKDGVLTSATELIDAHKYAVPECVETLLELVLPPVASQTELETEIIDSLTELLAIAADNDLFVVPLGTTLIEARPPATSARGMILERVYGEELRFAKNVAGTHIHFDQTDAIAQANLLTALDPALALIATTPYYDGQRTAASARAAAYRRSMSARFAPFRRLQPYMWTEAECNKRMHQTFELFIERARVAGIDRETVTEHFSPDDVIHGPVRIRNDIGTVEWRAPDTALPRQVIRLAYDIEGVLEQLAAKPLVVGPVPGVHSDRIVIPPFDRLEQLTTEAIYNGLTTPVQSYLRAFGIDVTAYAPLTEGFPKRDALSVAEARDLRRLYAGVLSDDVSMLRREQEGSQLLSVPLQRVPRYALE
ncbi:glutamate-cysteine ligase family protein [Halalkalicoccus salilacus]|uniref:glutamate-cysteine ligase family protein n=1 Tax=Halalkalicoccus salilacus TaxID=3117459 RepID=UPI00300F18F6